MQEYKVGQYTVKKYKETAYCSCPSWKYQSVPNSVRVCKHIRNLFPEFEPTLKKLKAPIVPLFVPYNPKRHKFNEGVWYWSEKLDGVRCYWNGMNLMTRSGWVIPLPPEIKKEFPKHALDGELYAGKNGFGKVLSFLQSFDFFPALHFVAFDVPGPERFEVRLDHLVKVKSGRFLRVHKYDTVTPVIEQELDRILSMGGEGIVLRSEDSMYGGGRRIQNGLKWKKSETLKGTVTSVSEHHVFVKVNKNAYKVPVAPHEKFKTNQKITLSKRGTQVRVN